jgi:hypothetical protein
MKSIGVNVNDVMKKNLTLTIKLYGLREFKVRTWLALQFIKLAALVAPFGVEIENR